MNMIFHPVTIVSVPVIVVMVIFVVMTIRWRSQQKRINENFADKARYWMNKGLF